MSTSSGAYRRPLACRNGSAADAWIAIAKSSSPWLTLRESCREPRHGPPAAAAPTVRRSRDWVRKLPLARPLSYLRARGGGEGGEGGGVEGEGCVGVGKGEGYLG